MYIDSQGGLKEFIQRCDGSTVLAIDTEFLREKTYYPQLCLLQLATENDCVIVDPLVVKDLSPLRPLLADPEVVKVFHAGDQDRSILYHDVGVIPTPVFDTQFAAMVLGHSQQLGLAALVKSFTGVALNKGDSYTDWGKRPLTQTQVVYALDDVRYLPGIYATMMERLKKQNRLSWIEQDFARMCDRANFEIDPENRWRRVKHTASLNSRQLALVKELAAWRERTAQKRDYPRKWVLTDELIVEIAKREPRNEEQLYHIRGLREKLGQAWTAEVLAAVACALRKPEKDLPRRERKARYDADCTGALDLMTALVHLRARQNHVATTLLSSQDDLLRVVTGEREQIPVLEGWRREVVGSELLELLKGKIALSLAGNDLVVSKRP
ncbi:MAG: ribonuclease D [Coriobacteriales bacterium]|nr:ribonuclease D [Coriobacteriales bacterium]